MKDNKQSIKLVEEIVQKHVRTLLSGSTISTIADNITQELIDSDLIEISVFQTENNKNGGQADK